MSIIHRSRGRGTHLNVTSWFSRISLRGQHSGFSITMMPCKWHSYTLTSGRQKVTASARWGKPLPFYDTLDRCIESYRWQLAYTHTLRKLLFHGGKITCGINMHTIHLASCSRRIDMEKTLLFLTHVVCVILLGTLLIIIVMLPSEMSALGSYSLPFGV